MPADTGTHDVPPALQLPAGKLGAGTTSGRARLHPEQQTDVDGLGRGLVHGAAGVVENWGRFLPEQATATALIDRLLHHAIVVTTNGESFRMRKAKTRTTTKRKETT